MEQEKKQLIKELSKPITREDSYSSHFKYEFLLSEIDKYNLS